MVDQRITVGPSMTLAVALGVVHLAAAGLLWLVPISLPGKAVFTLAIAASLVYFMARDALRHASQAIVELEIRDGFDLSCQSRGGEWFDCELLGSTYVSPWLTIVNVRPLGQPGVRHVILVPDNVEPEDFRRLRTWLRWKRADRSVADPAGDH